MSYRLAVDLGTTFIAAATDHDGSPAILALGNRALQIPSVVYAAESGEFFVGEAAEIRGTADPSRLAREFKRRIGDDTPFLLGDRSATAEQLAAEAIRWVVERATERLGCPPAQLVLTHPASWQAFKRGKLRSAAHLAGVVDVVLCSEPEAAGARYVVLNKVPEGAVLMVYDLGGGTFDVSVVRRRGGGFDVLGTPAGIEWLGGVDFDDLIFERVFGYVAGQYRAEDLEGAEASLQLARLRRDCVELKESLSSDTSGAVVVNLAGRTNTVRVTRHEFEELVIRHLQKTVDTARTALQRADLGGADPFAIVLVGGSSRIPMIAELLQREFGVPVTLDIHPKHDTVQGALLAAAPDLGSPRLELAPVRQPAEDATAEPDEGSGSEQVSGEGSPNSSTVPDMEAPTVAAAPIEMLSDHARAQQPTHSHVRSRVARRSIALGVCLAVIIAGAAGSIFWLRQADQRDLVGTSPPSPSVAGVPSLAGSTGEVPRSAPLAADEFVMAMNVGANVDVFLGSTARNSPTQRLTDSAVTDFAPVLSPDRSTVLYVQQFADTSSGAERRALRVMAAGDGAGDRPLFDPVPSQCAGAAFRPAWNPMDPSLLALTCRDLDGVEGLYLIRLDGTVLREVDIGEPKAARWSAADPTFSPDGKQLAFWSGPSGLDGGSLYVVPTDGSAKPRRLTTPEAAGGDADPAWSPDGREIAFRRVLGAGESGRTGIYRVALDGGDAEPVPVIISRSSVLEPTWSEDGLFLAYISREAVPELGTESVARAWVVGLEGADARVLWTAGDLGPQTGPSWTRR